MGGGLMSYGADPLGLFRQAASYVDRILKGASPAELSVEGPKRAWLVINIKAAIRSRRGQHHPLVTQLVDAARP